MGQSRWWVAATKTGEANGKVIFRLGAVKVFRDLNLDTSSRAHQRALAAHSAVSL